MATAGELAWQKKRYESGGSMRAADIAALGEVGDSRRRQKKTARQPWTDRVHREHAASAVGPGGAPVTASLAQAKAWQQAAVEKQESTEMPGTVASVASVASVPPEAQRDPDGYYRNSRGQIVSQSTKQKELDKQWAKDHPNANAGTIVEPTKGSTTTTEPAKPAEPAKDSTTTTEPEKPTFTLGKGSFFATHDVNGNIKGSVQKQLEQGAAKQSAATAHAKAEAEAEASRDAEAAASAIVDAKAKEIGQDFDASTNPDAAATHHAVQNLHQTKETGSTADFVAASKQSSQAFKESSQQNAAYFAEVDKELEELRRRQGQSDMLGGMTARQAKFMERRMAGLAKWAEKYGGLLAQPVPAGGMLAPGGPGRRALSVVSGMPGSRSPVMDRGESQTRTGTKAGRMAVSAKSSARRKLLERAR